MMKGIILAGGSGTRLYPATQVISKQLLPVGDKPMIYYPLSTLMLAGIREIMLISTPRDLPMYEDLLGDGSCFGISLTYQVQEKPAGLAQAFILGEEFLAGGPVCLILGDNVFYGHGLTEVVREGAQLTEGGLIFGYHVKDPERYGVVEFDDNDRVVSIEEKPAAPKSSYAILGLYFFDGHASEIAKKVTPSARGELEITSVQNNYLEQGKLKVLKVGQGIAWLDTGTYESLYDASSFIMTIQKRQGLQIGCLEEIAYNQGWIDRDTLMQQAVKLKNTEYGKYLVSLIEK